MSTSTSSLGSDDLVVVTEDPKYDEHSHPHQSQVCVADDAPVIHVPPLHPLLYANTTGTHTPNSGYDYIYGMGIQHSGRSKSRTGGSKSSLKQKALKYKSPLRASSLRTTKLIRDTISKTLQILQY